MSLRPLIERVARAERQLEAREQRTRAHVQQAKATWHAGWTPWRIVVAGLAAGFAVGHARPLRLVDGGDLLKLAGLLPGLLARRDAQPPNADDADTTTSTSSTDDNA
ncbi:MAG: hypothetical protein QM612_04885 [Thermomonas sp.]|uniref:hypothetical protein n=1 Tax=Thermomonas sp. TaxID=1971895 RepID=UPI0039E298E0